MQRFDWRWIGAIGLIVLLTQVRWLPWYALAGLLAAGGGYFLMVGWNTWRRRGGASVSGKKVTYWRGQRIEVAPTRRSAAAPQLKDIGPALIFLLIGGAMVLAAANMIFRNLAVLF